MTLRLAASLLALVGAGACSESSIALVYPQALIDGSAQAAILLYLSNEDLGAEVMSAELIEPPFAGHHSFELQDPTKNRFRLLVYSDRAALDALMLTAGPLPRATGGEGAPIPRPDTSHLSSPLDGPGAAWSPVSRFDPSLLPWRVPTPPSGADCTDVTTRAMPIPGLEFARTRGLLALGGGRALLAGQSSETDGITARESLFLLVSNIDERPSFESIATPIPGEEYRGLIELEPGVFLVVSGSGWLTRVNLETREVRTASTSLEFGYWYLTRGDDGTVAVFDARRDPGSPRGWAHFVDPENLTVAQIEAPEPFYQLEVVRRDFMIASGARTLYRFEDGIWVGEREINVEGSEILRQGEHFFVMLGGLLLVQRSPDGTWTEHPHELPVFDLSVGSSFPDGRLIFGGGAGFLAQFQDGEWCNIRRSLSRSVLGMAPIPGERAALTVTYGDQPGEIVGFTRINFGP